MVNYSKISISFLHLSTVISITFKQQYVERKFPDELNQTLLHLESYAKFVKLNFNSHHNEQLLGFDCRNYLFIIFTEILMNTI